MCWCALSCVRLCREAPSAVHRPLELSAKPLSNRRWCRSRHTRWMIDRVGVGISPCDACVAHFRACAFAAKHRRRFLDHWLHRCSRLQSPCHRFPIVVGVDTTGTHWIAFVLHRSVYAMTPISVCALSGMQLAGRHLLRFTYNWTHFHCSRSPIGASTVDDVDASSFDKFKCTETTQGWIPTHRPSHRRFECRYGRV